MSKSTVRGKIENFSPKPDEDYFGVLVDTGKQDQWFNGQGNIPENWEKGSKIKLEVNKNGFIDISDFELVDDKNNASGGSGSDQSGEAEVSDMDGQRKAEGTATESFVSKQERIKVQCAFKKAVDQVDRRSCETEEDYCDIVKSLTLIHVEVLDEVMS